MNKDWVRVSVDDGSFLLSDAGETAPDTLDFATGLIATMDVGAMISAGLHTGSVQVRAEACARRPPVGELSEWDDVCEASVYAPHGQLRVETLYEGACSALPLLSIAGPGWYRVRATVRGRDTAPDAVLDEPVEQYLLACWPAPPATPLILRATDTVGRGLRRNSVRLERPVVTSAPAVPEWEDRAAANLRAKAQRKPD